MDTIFVLGVALIISLIFLIFTKYRTSSSSKSNTNLPPGETGWPLLGETLDFSSRPTKFIQDRMKKHSLDVFQTTFALENIAVFCGASGNKFIYSNSAKLRAWIPRYIAKGFSLKDNCYDGSPSWKLLMEQTHKFFKQDSLKEYVQFMDSKAHDHFNKYWVPYNQVKVLNVSKDFTFSLACHLIVNCTPDPLAVPFYTLADRILSVPLNFPGTSYNKALKASKVVKEKLVEIITRKAQILSTLDASGRESHQDLLSRIIMASNEDFCSNLSSAEALAGQIITVLFAGFHTTNTAITFLLSHLADYPEVYAKVLQEQLEIARTKKQGELLTLEDIQKMTYTWNVIRESLRLRPPVMGTFREAITDISYAGFTIPKGWKIHWNVYTTYVDPTYFPNPEKFDPSRFEEILPPNVFLPFGAGSHMCCARDFARLQILVYAHSVVTRFKISKVNPNEKIIYKAYPIPVEGLPILLHPHEK